MPNTDHGTPEMPGVRLGGQDDRAAEPAALTPSLAAAVAVVSLGCGVFAMYAFSLSVGEAPWPWWMQIPVQSAGMLALVAGIVMLLRGPHLIRMGALLVAYGMTWYIGDLQFSENRFLFGVGFCLFFFNAAIMAHIVLSFPTGRLRDPATTVVVVGLYSAILVTQTARYLVEDSPPPQVWGDPNAAGYSPWAPAGTVAGMVLCAAVFVLVIRRWRTERPPMRRSAAPVWFSAALAMVIVAGFLVVALTHAAVQMNYALLFGYATAVLIVPVASQVGYFREWIGRAGAFERLAHFEQTESADYRELLAKWLGDPEIEIYPWLPDQKRYASPKGETVEFPNEASRDVTLLEWRGQPLGVLIHDSSLTGARQLQSVATVTRIILAKEALQAQLRRSLNMLIDLEIKHRKELQSVLHDGGQDAVIGVLITLHELKDELGEQAEPGVVDLVQDGIARSKELQNQIKEFAFELYPSALDFGLNAGVTSLFDKLRLPSKDVTIPETRCPQRVEHVAYRVISEAVRNARTHAHAHRIQVKVTHRRDWLVVEVTDDGVGGADSPQSWGVGSRRARELVTVLGGNISIDSPLGVGTTVKAELPCTS